jgi:hypothetical protein
MDAAEAGAATPSASVKGKRSGRSHVMPFRLSDEEYQRLRTMVKEAGLTVTALVRDHIGKVQVTVRDREAERQRNALLNRINANLNMIAKWVNTYKSKADAFPVVARLDAIQDEVLRLVEAWEGKTGDRGVFQVRHRQR